MNSNQDQNAFSTRHLGCPPEDMDSLLKSIGAASIDSLLSETLPGSIRLDKKLDLGPARSEAEWLEYLNGLAAKNKIFRNYIGMGYYGCHTPSVIRRNILENPGWYTQYTPYQSEISQGRLEALLNFQTLIIDLTAMEVANASLLDEATAAAEAMFMAWNLTAKKPGREQSKKILVSGSLFPQTLDVLKTRAEAIGIEIVVGNLEALLSPDYFGAIMQYPDGDGQITDCGEFCQRCKENGVFSIVVADLFSLTLLTPPGEYGADIAVGSTQRFGVPLGYGGPHAAYFAARNEHKRFLPGRIIGVSLDRRGKSALRMSLQTREQHIRREKATSNICTAQVLLAVMAGMYAVYHGPKGLLAIGSRIHKGASRLASALKESGAHQVNTHFFDTLKIKFSSPDERGEVEKKALRAGVNFRYFPDGVSLGISLDETSTEVDLTLIASIFGAKVPAQEGDYQSQHPHWAQRRSNYLKHPVFHRYHSETEMMRYLKRLENKDLSLTISMIPLGSCTMKLNAATEMLPVTWPEFCNLHPFAPLSQTKGYQILFKKLEDSLKKISGLDAVSLQPNSGAQGEYAGLLVIRAYHRNRKQGHRRVVLIPTSAHGTNPASAALAGMEIVLVQCDEEGNIDREDLKSKAKLHRNHLAALMVTYPSTHGVFEESIRDVCAAVHKYGGLVYMDGANMNAQVGYCHPGSIGADVCHINLHKTFCIPHGGGGPGMGPICVTKKLKPFLPGHSVVSLGGPKSITAVSAAPWGSSNILLISQAFIEMMGEEGLSRSTATAILNANYMVNRLKDHYPVLYSGRNNRVAHEFILDFRPFKQSAKVEVTDVAKRLMDFGFHAPTVSFPVPGTLMIEPTESESKAELDRFCDSLIQIRSEIREIEKGEADTKDNVLMNAPHTAEEVVSDNWTHPYSREKAAFPLPWVREGKFWPAVSRVDNSHGDKNLICACPMPTDWDTAHS